MKLEFIRILVCPACKSSLDLIDPAIDKGDVITGTLFCGQCSCIYPVKDGIPNLLPADKSQSGNK